MGSVRLLPYGTNGDLALQNAVTTVDRAVLEAASQADVVTFGSPSTVK